jgi:hypothetical protein
MLQYKNLLILYLEKGFYAKKNLEILWMSELKQTDNSRQWLPRNQSKFKLEIWQKEPLERKLVPNGKFLWTSTSCGQWFLKQSIFEHFLLVATLPDMYS